MNWRVIIHYKIPQMRSEADSRGYRRIVDAPPLAQTASVLVPDLVLGEYLGKIHDTFPMVQSIFVFPEPR